MPEKRKYLRPVAWLGGRDLLANLKYFLLFAAFKGKLDPRDWMNAEIFPREPTTNDWEKEYLHQFNNSFANLKEEKQEFWFDYFADCGDGMTAGYAIAYLCMSDLHVRVPDNWDNLSAAGKRQALEDDSAEAEIRSHLEAEHFSTVKKEYKSIDKASAIVQKLEDETKPRSIIEEIEKSANGVVLIEVPKVAGKEGTVLLSLPRGAFLFVGGDTAYHVADFAGLGLRVQKVFDWALEDLKKARNLNEKKAEEEYWRESRRRPIFGVPGNHDYYDMTDGFNRQFARPVTRENNFINLDGRDLPPQLRLRAFKRFQTASYVAIKLPFGWWFWGIDSELTRVDIRQQEFFKRSYSSYDEAAARLQVERQLAKELGGPRRTEELNDRFPRLQRYPLGDRWPMPHKLIVATSEPTTVEGRRARDDKDIEDKTPQAFSFLDLTRPFLYLKGTLGDANGSKSKAKASKKRPKTPKEFRNREKLLELVDFECRLDISGDVHHYARYWGDESREDAVAAENYASIVSGGGGAAMSPTQTDYNEVEEQAIYPSKEVSKRVINDQLFKPWVVIRGGNVWLAGLVIAFVLYFGAANPEHIRLTNALIESLSKGGFWDLFTSEQVRHVVKLLLLLALAGWAIIASGLYAQWLFTRMTKTYDWVRDKRENLRLKETEEPQKTGKDPAERSLESQDDLDKENKTSSKVYDAKGEDNLYVDFLREAKSSAELRKEGGEEKEKEKEEPNPLETRFGDDLELDILYRKFLDKSQTQRNAGVAWRRIMPFWKISLLTLLLTVGLGKVETVSGYLQAVLFLVLVLLLSWNLWRTYKLSRRLAEELADIPHYDPKHPAENFWKVIQLSVTRIHDYVPFWVSLAGPGVLVLVLALRNYERFKGTLPIFGNSASILFSIFVTGAAVVVAIYYSKWLFDQSYRIKVNLVSYIPVMALSGIALLTLIVALARCGIVQANHIIIDCLFFTAILAVIGGCIVLATLVGNHVRKGWRTLGFFGLGTWHGVLQLLVPFLLVWFGNGWAFLFALIVVGIFAAIGILGTRWKTDSLIRKRILPLLWVFYGAIMIAIPLWQHRVEPGLTSPGVKIIVLGSFVLAATIGWAFAASSIGARVLTAASAALLGAIMAYAVYWLKPSWATWLLAGWVGAVMSCVWLGWYFAVSLVFDGHANEAGSTARTEDYKQFIRFRVTENTLTGFVIGIDFPHAPKDENDPRNGSTLKPRLIDVFTLKCGPPPEPG